jgi:hypothetical protein
MIPGNRLGEAFAALLALIAFAAAAYASSPAAPVLLDQALFAPGSYDGRFGDDNITSHAGSVRAGIRY